MGNHLFEDRISVNPYRICFYSQYVGERRTRQLPKLQGKQLREHQSGLSHKSGIKLKNAINTLVYTATYKTVWVKEKNYKFRYKINFITLTLPSRQIHTDKEIISKVLSPFLEAWSKRRPGLLYVWKAEVQDNGNIHFHITANAFYHYKKLRRDWNKAVNKLGYVERSKLSDPNSTDVHPVHKVRNIAAYLVAYCSKKDLYKKPLKKWFKRHNKALIAQDHTIRHLPKKYFDNIKRTLSCNIWSCSKILLRNSITIDPNHTDISKDIRTLLHPSVPIVKYDYCNIIYLENDVLELLPQLHQEYLKAFSPVIEQQLLIPETDII